MSLHWWSYFKVSLILLDTFVKRCDVKVILKISQFSWSVGIFLEHFVERLNLSPSLVSQKIKRSLGVLFGVVTPSAFHTASVCFNFTQMSSENIFLCPTICIRSVASLWMTQSSWTGIVSGPPSGGWIWGNRVKRPELVSKIFRISPLHHPIVTLNSACCLCSWWWKCFS